MRPLKREKPLQWRGFSGKQEIGGYLLSRAKARSIIGEEGLDFRVRNGVGYIAFSMAAINMTKYILTGKGK